MHEYVVRRCQYCLSFFFPSAAFALKAFHRLRAFPISLCVSDTHAHKEGNLCANIIFFLSSPRSRLIFIRVTWIHYWWFFLHSSLCAQFILFHIYFFFSSLWEIFQSNVLFENYFAFQMKLTLNSKRQRIASWEDEQSRYHQQQHLPKITDRRRTFRTKKSKVAFTFCHWTQSLTLHSVSAILPALINCFMVIEADARIARFNAQYRYYYVHWTLNKYIYTRFE